MPHGTTPAPSTRLAASPASPDAVACTHVPADDCPPWWLLELDGKRLGLRGRKLRAHCERRWATYAQSCDGPFTGLDMVSGARACTESLARGVQS